MPLQELSGYITSKNQCTKRGVAAQRRFSTLQALKFISLKIAHICALGFWGLP